MNEYYIFYSEPGFAFWRVLRTWSPFGAKDVASDFVHDFKGLIETGQIAEKQVPQFIMVRGFCLN